ncbi:Septum formation initiator [Caloramator fervidus]|uniref:Septum formation initiator n=1 Tax=Caloramator fervidus TaxID=29344 RepID=A0A1H5UXP7_9CLOT|nr:septum formation initiator family protein [Caloramator fervidus]SEF79865.1 Septum formation initiator [Caloramator fervidus]
MKKIEKLFYLFFLIFFLSIFIKQQAIMFRLKKDYRHYSQQLEKVKFINAQLKEELKQVQKDSYIETLAREKLGLIKPGEILFIDKNKRKTN